MLFTEIHFLVKFRLFIWPVALYAITEFYRKEFFFFFLEYINDAVHGTLLILFPSGYYVGFQLPAPLKLSVVN